MKLDGMDETKIIEILSSPWRWGETYLVNRDGSPRKYWDHQKEDLDCPSRRIMHRDGRDVGKSVDLTTRGLYIPFVNRGYEVLITAPLQGHLDNLIEEIEFQIDKVPDIQDSIARKRGGRQLDIKRAPYHRYRFSNGSMLHLVPAGHDGNALRSYHVMAALVDEAARLSIKAWKALDGCVKSGGTIVGYSNPDGRRNTPYYRFTQSDKWFVFKWPSWVNPNWTEETARDKEVLHGGRNTEGWVHEVVGEHGSPAYGTFNLDHFYQAQKEKDGYMRLDILGEDFKDILEGENEQMEEAIASRIVDLLGSLAGMPGVFYWAGCDFGYAKDPTEIVIFAENDKGALIEKVRIHCERIDYPIQSALLAELERLYKFSGIGLDVGGNGLSVFQEIKLLNQFADVRENGLIGRLRIYGFGESLVIDVDEDGQETKKNTKVYATDLWTGRMQRKEVVFAKEDDELEGQVIGHTYNRTDRTIVYSKGNDHILDAIRCMFLVLESLQRLEGLHDVEEIEIVNLRIGVSQPIFGV